MYSIDSATRAKIYNGGLYYTPIIRIGNTQISYQNIKSISIDDPIIDTTENQMYIGTFIAKKLEIEFRTLQNIDLTEQITYIIQINDNNVITEVPIGVFNIETSPADYYKTYKISALDNSVKFKNAFDFESEYDKKANEKVCQVCFDLLDEYIKTHTNKRQKSVKMVREAALVWKICE